jgi:hypothetical protein
MFDCFASARDVTEFDLDQTPSAAEFRSFALSWRAFPHDVGKSYFGDEEVEEEAPPEEEDVFHTILASSSVADRRLNPILIASDLADRCCRARFCVSLLRSPALIEKIQVARYSMYRLPTQAERKLHVIMQFVSRHEDGQPVLFEGVVLCAEAIRCVFGISSHRWNDAKHVLRSLRSAKGDPFFGSNEP